MGLYARYVFPRLMEWTLGRERYQQERRAALASAQGEVLEIGFGTGLNLPHYPDAVTRLTIVDLAELLPARVAERIANARFPVERARLDAERLPFADARFDCVVSTWTLCSIPDPVAALREVRRVLRPKGAYLFLEHGRSDDSRVARWQDRLNPLQRVVACGCNINRPIDALVRAAGLAPARLERYVMRGEPRLFAEMYRGAAVRST